MDLIIIIIAIIAILLFFLLLQKIDKIISPKDTREPYFRNENKQVMAVKIQGEQGSLPNHEDFMHNGLPHQNPLVETKSKINFLKFWNPFTVIETRYYPVTRNDDLPMAAMINELQNSIIRMYDDRVKLVALTEKQEKAVYEIESQGQINNGRVYMRPRKET